MSFTPQHRTAAAPPTPRPPCDHPAAASSLAAAGCRDAAPGWVERYQARVQAAKAHLTRIGLKPWREDAAAKGQQTAIDAQGDLPKWRVPGIGGPLGNDDLIAVAQHYGFEAEAAHG
ncbi:hypothetical protein [Allosphingosinicella indica]|uniref:Uncharacterized protein n=1 Tax=Allosphingosinicella indica TaxID=941907 RepID=A0A1X7GKZ7_9SPHN|nr:hypothetical protein [Allosphingosinicella indica]SMF70637.1 hypothetical protein SAMN06295910_1919 [Allosphingosinicella indica]